jgi:plastocyanin
MKSNQKRFMIGLALTMGLTGAIAYGHNPSGGSDDPPSGGLNSPAPGSSGTAQPGILPSMNPGATPVATAAATTNPTACPSPGNVTVNIEQGAVGKGPAAYGANPLVVSPGATVTWMNQDSVPHTVTANDGSFDSGTLSPGQTYSHTFNAPGTSDYYCAIHGQASMSGKVEVSSSCASPTPTTSLTPAAASPTPLGTLTPAPGPVISVTPVPSRTSSPPFFPPNMGGMPPNPR